MSGRPALPGVRVRVTIIAALALVPPLALLVYTAAQWHRHEIEDAQETALLVARHFASVYEREVGGAGPLLLPLARVIEAARDEAAIRTLLQGALENHPRYRTFGTITRAGAVVAAGQPPPPVGELTSRPVFRTAVREGAFAMGAWEFDSAARTATIMFVLPARESVVGALFSIMDLAWLSGLAAQGDLLPAGSTIAVFDGTGRIVAHWPEAARAGLPVAGDPAVQMALAHAGEERFEATSPFDGVPRLFALTPLRSSNQAGLLHLSVGIPKSAATARVERILLQDLGVFGVALLFSLIALGLASTRVIVPFIETPIRIEREHNAALMAANAVLEAEIAERKRAEAVVEKLSGAIKDTADSVVITNREGVIEYVNPAFEEMTGFSRDESVGRTPRLLKSGAHSRSFYESLWTTILSGRTFRSIMTNRRRNGMLYDEDQTISPVRDAAGAITHFVSTGRDITQRKRMEAALRRMNVRLEQEAARLASVLHDEAGQFLTSAHMTLADLSRETPPAVSERLQEVRWQLDRVEERLRRLSHELHPRVVQDLGLCEAVTFYVEAFTRRTGLPVDIDSAIGHRLPLGVETLLYRVVQEGLTNVHRHAHATRARVWLRDEGNMAACGVRDDGEGFADRPFAGRDNGGLGLRIMQDRLEAVGGTLAVDSIPGRGTELRVSVPVEV